MTTAERLLLRAHVRWLIRRDYPEVLAIENASFHHPWGEPDFLRELRRRDCIGMVAESGERVVGHMVYRLGKDRLELLNFAVDPAFRRMGVGTQMVAKLVGKLSSHRRTRIVLDVRESNLAGQLFLRSQGFLATGVRREHFEDTNEDAYTMTYAYQEETR